MHSLRSLNIKQSRGGTDGGREGGREAARFPSSLFPLAAISFHPLFSCGEARKACMGKADLQNESGDEYEYSNIRRISFESVEGLESTPRKEIGTRRPLYCVLTSLVIRKMQSFFGRGNVDAVKRETNMAHPAT